MSRPMSCLCGEPACRCMKWNKYAPMSVIPLMMSGAASPCPPIITILILETVLAWIVICVVIQPSLPPPPLPPFPAPHRQQADPTLTYSGGKMKCIQPFRWSQAPACRVEVYLSASIAYYLRSWFVKGSRIKLVYCRLNREGVAEIQ